MSTTKYDNYNHSFIKSIHFQETRTKLNYLVNVISSTRVEPVLVMSSRKSILLAISAIKLTRNAKYPENHHRAYQNRNYDLLYGSSIMWRSLYTINDTIYGFILYELFGKTFSNTFSSENRTDVRVERNVEGILQCVINKLGYFHTKNSLTNYLLKTTKAEINMKQLTAHDRLGFSI